MVKTAFRIDMDYQESLRQARKLEDAARTIQTERSKLANARDAVASAWKGDNASAFIKKIQTAEARLKKVEKNIRNSAEEVRTQAKDIYDADMKASARWKK